MRDCDLDLDREGEEWRGLVPVVFLFDEVWSCTIAAAAAAVDGRGWVVSDWVEGCRCRVRVVYVRRGPY